MADGVRILARIRLYCADVLKAQGKLSVPADRFDFLWVVISGCSLSDRSRTAGIPATPFTRPVAEDVPMLKTTPGKVRGQHYDVVVNGVELGGGSIRIHRPECRRPSLKTCCKSRRMRTKLRFATCWTFRYGAPPQRRHRPRLTASMRSYVVAQHSRRDCLPEDCQRHMPHDRPSPPPVSRASCATSYIEVKAAKKDQP